MQKEKIKNIICWLLVAVCMGVIFYFSSRTAAESSQQSNFFVELFRQLFGSNAVTDFIVRKSAHFLEFTGLALLFALALFVQYGKLKTPSAVLFTSLYAVTDEIHQIFVEGRACKITDWAIDTAGAVLGAAAFLIIVKLSEKIISHKKAKQIDTNFN